MRALLAKKETLEASLRTFEPEDIKNIPALKEQLNIGHQHIVSINLKINVMIKGWNSAEKKQFLIQVENQFQQIEWFSLTGLKKSFAFTSWFDDAEQKIANPVCRNSVERMYSLGEVSSQLQPTSTLTLSCCQAEQTSGDNNGGHSSHLWRPEDRLWNQLCCSATNHAS